MVLVQVLILNKILHPIRVEFSILMMLLLVFAGFRILESFLYEYPGAMTRYRDGTSMSGTVLHLADFCCNLAVEASLEYEFPYNSTLIYELAI